MNSHRVYELGHMLGLEHEDIQDIISKKLITETSANLTSPKEIYPKGTLYGTICISDF